MKIFSLEIQKLFSRFKQGKPFAFNKFCDGEWMAMQNIALNNNEFENSPNIPQIYRDKLVEALQYKDPNYYIGVSCSCCFPDHAEKMRELSGQDDEHMTFANIFVNSNYLKYKQTFLEEFKKYKIHLVANENAKIEDLPFDVEKFYPVGFSAWVNNYDLIEEIKNSNESDKLFLFACGPFGNLLTHQLFDHNKENIYLDVGSTLNPWTQSEGFKRDYYTYTQGQTPYASRDCSW
tara:strand:- start:4473 stop:5174 length:702 start_codon:yes stop_codon:yes gene_type:complete